MNTTGKKHGGREKGSENVSTRVWRDLVGGILYDNREELIKRLKNLDDPNFVRAYASLLRFVCPQLSSVSIGDEDGGNDFMKMLRDLSKDAEKKE